jgi:ABC-2 type transport system permease protein
MHTLKVLYTFFKTNLQEAFAYRVDTAVNIGTSLFWLLWELAGLSIIFNNANTIGGWRLGDILALSGVWRILQTFMFVFVWPNTEKFNRGVREGTLDYTLLQPLNSQFSVSFNKMAVWRIVDFILGIMFIGIGLAWGGEIPPLINAVSFLALIVSGLMVIYGLWIVLIAATFWLTKFDNNVTILQALLDSGRYPSVVYPIWLRVIVTFVIPIAVATTVPLQALRGDLAWWQIFAALLSGVLVLWLSSLVWRTGVKRYSGASA